MSTITKTGRVRTHYVCTEDGRLVLVPGDQTRLNRATSWVFWHAPELTGIAVPAVLAAPVAAWLSLMSVTAAVLAAVCLVLVSVAVAAGWIVRDVRRARENAAIRAGRDLPATVVDDPPGVGSDVDGAAGTGPVGTVDETSAGVLGDAPVGATSEPSGGVWL